MHDEHQLGIFVIVVTVAVQCPAQEFERKHTRNTHVSYQFHVGYCTNQIFRQTLEGSDNSEATSRSLSNPNCCDWWQGFHPWYTTSYINLLSFFVIQLAQQMLYVHCSGLLPSDIVSHPLLPLACKVSVHRK